MKKILTLALLWATITAQAQQADTMTLVVFNTARNFVVTAADFGGLVTKDIVGDMVRSYDTVRVLKAHPTAKDSSGKSALRHQEERRCDRITGDVKDKIVLIEYNKDCDVTQMCLNAQRAGAKSIVIIHDSDEKKVYKLTKKGLYKDSIRIPVFTVPNRVADNITALLPSVIGIALPVTPTSNSAVAQNDNPLAQMTDKTPVNTGDKELINTDLLNGGFGKQGFTVSPNPTRNQANVSYQFLKPTDAILEVKTASGQVLSRQILRGVSKGDVSLPTVDYPNGTYFITLQYGKEVQTKKLVVRH